MSQSNFTAVACCSTSNDMPKDKLQLRKLSLTKLLKPASQRLNFLHVVNKQNAMPKPLLGVPSDTLFFHQQQPCQNISFKSLPLISARDSLENIHRIHRYNKYPRRNLLRCFFKVNNLEKRPRRRLCQNRDENCTDSIKLSLFKNQTNPDLNVWKLRYQLAKEKKEFNIFDIGKFKQNIKNRFEGSTSKKMFNDTLHRGLSYAEVVSLCEEHTRILDTQILFKGSDILRQNTGASICELDSFESDSRITIQESDADSVSEILRPFDKLNLGQLESQNQFECLDTPRPKQSAEGLEENYFNSKLNHSANWVCHTDLEESESNLTSSDKIHSSIDAKPKIDFSSGDDSRDLSLNLKTEDNEGIHKLEDIGSNHVKDFDFGKRSVQWNSEVDVIYYAGDTDGDKIVRREREPLREEADQQARRSGFIQVALNKNLISALNTCQFLDPWITIFHK